MFLLGTVRNKECAIVGSSPDVIVPSNINYIIGANGGAGIKGADILATTAYLFRGKVSKSEASTLDVLRGLKVHTIVVDTKDGKKEAVIDGCKKFNIRYQHIVSIGPTERNDIIFKASGLNLGKGPVYNRVSTGVFAACLALISGAAYIVLCGISFHNGYSYNREMPQRQHVPADLACIKALVQRYEEKIFTTSKDLWSIGINPA